MNVVQSIYTFDEKVLIYAEYDELLHDIVEKVKKYYDIKERNKWSLFAYLGCVGILTSIILAIIFFRQLEILSFALAFVGCLLSSLVALFCWHRVRLSEQKSKQLTMFLERELKEINARDNEVRSLRLLNRKDFNKVRKVEPCEGGYYYIYFDSNVYTKPCIMDGRYFLTENKIDLSIYDDYYTEVKKRIGLLKNSKTLQKLNSVNKKS